ncbi:MAG: hypothetical protein COA52_16430 [Hyphomicrobiales bacterium]|nr:MAG: hypothetical protein COA52_16430 [Hyphomicrobiales bacterium]
MTGQHQNITLDQIPANRDLIEELYAHGKISREARSHALHLIHPHALWGLWISRLLVAFGTALVLAGIIFFFAFNWARITPLMKFSLIEFGVVLCLAGAFFFTLKSLGGQVLLLCCSVLVGVFMAVFGQIYQTGADAYQLFMMWSLLTLGWTLLSRFTAQWVFWLVITNLFLVFWWEQGSNHSKTAEYTIYLAMGLLNGAALGLREYLVLFRGSLWPAARWTRAALVIATLFCALVLVIHMILDENRMSLPIAFGGVAGLVGLAAIYLIYRFRFSDMWPLAAAVLSICLIVTVTCIKLLVEADFGSSGAATLFYSGLVTLIVFSLAGGHLKNLMVDHD